MDKPRPKWPTAHSTQSNTFHQTNTLFCVIVICLSVCLSVTYLLSTQYWNVVESSYFEEVTVREWWFNSKTKCQRSRSLGKKIYKSFFAHVFIKGGSIYVGE